MAGWKAKVSSLLIFLLKQPPDVFYKKAILKKFYNIHRKTPAESLFNIFKKLQASGLKF